MILISRARRVSIGCFRYRSKSSSLLAFNSSRFLFSSIAVSDKSLNLCNQCTAFRCRDNGFVPGSILSNNSNGPIISARTIPSVERKSRRLVSKCKKLADRCIRDVRTLSYVLHPPVLDAAGLGDAIRDYVNGFTKRSGIRVELELSPRVGRMPQDVELALFRVVQEALTNIQRHSGSQRAKIRIDRNSDLTLEISDRGHGTSVSRQRRKEEPRLGIGVGVPSMQERVNLIGGRFEIDSTSHGTTVRVAIPLRENEREETSHPDS